MRRMGWVLAVCAAVTALAATAATARADTTIYRSTVEPLPGNLPSQAFQATQMSELGDEVTFAHHARKLKSVTVTMSSWGCQQGSWNFNNCVTTPGATFSWPITLNLYKVTTTTTPDPLSPVLPDDLIASVTKTFKIPYRPSANPTKCTANPGQWFKNGQCYNGKAANITFGLGSLHLRLPNHVVWGIAFNTSNYGPHPVGTAPCDSTPQGCPYDSLNLALSPKLKVGFKPFGLTAFQNTATAGNLCDGGAVAETNVFNLDSPGNACWFDSTTNTKYIPSAKFVADS